MASGAVQQKSFVGWLSHVLKGRSLEIKTFPDDLTDGILLANAYELLTSKPLLNKIDAKPKLDVQRLSNLNTVITAFETEGLKLTCGPEMIQKGNSKMILGLLWTLIRRYQLNEGADKKESEITTSTSKEIHTSTSAPSEEKPSAPAPTPIVSTLIAEVANLKLDNVTYDPKEKLSTNVKDGIIFCVMVKNRVPNVDFNVAELQKDKQIQNLTLAFTRAETHLDIPALLEPEDVAEGRVDEKSLTTYLSYFRKHPIVETPTPKPVEEPKVEPVKEPVVVPAPQPVQKDDSEAKRQIEELATENGKLRQELDQTKRQLTEATAHRTDARSEVDQLKRQLAEVTSQKNTVQQELDQVKRQIADASNQHIVVQKSFEQSKTELRTSQSSLEALKKELKDAKSQIEDLRKALEASKRETESQTKSLEAAEVSASNLAKELAAKKDQESDLKNDKQKLEIALRAAEETIEKLRNGEEEDQQKFIDEMEAQMNSAIRDIQDQLEKNQAEMKKLQEEKDQLSKQLTDVTAQYEKDKAELEALAKEKRKYEKEIEFLQDRLGEETEESSDFRSQIAKLKEKLETTTKEELVVSQRSKKGETNVKQLTSQFNKVLAQKESMEKELKKNEEKMDKLKKNKEEEIRKLKQKLNEESKKGSSKGGNTKEIAQLKKQYEELTSERAKIEVQCNSLKALMEKEKNDKLKAERELKETSTKLNEEQKEINRLRLRRNYYKRKYTSVKLDTPIETLSKSSSVDTLESKNNRDSLAPEESKSPKPKKKTETGETRSPKPPRTTDSEFAKRATSPDQRKQNRKSMPVDQVSRKTKTKE